MREKFFAITNSLLKPRETFRQIQNPPYADLSLAVLVTLSIVTAVNRVQQMQAKINMLNVFLMIIASIVSVVVGTILYAALLDFTANLFDKKSKSSNKIRLALPFALIPFIIGGLILIFPMGKESMQVINIACSIWSLVLMTLLISEIRKFSIVKSIVTIVVASLIVTAPLMVIYGIMNAARH